MRNLTLTRLAHYALLFAVAWIGSAQAQPRSCSVNSGTVAFGAYYPMSGANLDTTGSVGVTCNRSFSAVMSLSIGNGTGATYLGGRKMTRGGGGTLTYNLYDSAARNQVFGDGTGGSVTHTVSGSHSATQSIWGRIPGGQRTVLAGSYTDTVVVTISY